MTALSQKERIPTNATSSFIEKASAIHWLFSSSFVVGSALQLGRRGGGWRSVTGHLFRPIYLHDFVASHNRADRIGYAIGEQA